MPDNTAPLNPDEAASQIKGGMSSGSNSQALPDPESIDAPEPKGKRGVKPGTKRGPYSKTRGRKAKMDPGTELGARILNQVFFEVCQGFGGEDMAPTPEERKTLDTQLAEYLVYKETEIPPGVALALAYSAFVASKLKRPSVRERLKFAKDALLAKVKSIKFKSKKKGENQ